MPAKWPRAHVGPALMVAGAKALAGASIVALNLWVAHHLAPAAYGVFAVAVTALMLMDGVVGTAFDAAVIRGAGANPEEAASASEHAGLLMKLGAGLLVSAGAAIVIGIAVSPVAAAVAALAGLGGTGMLAHRSLLVYLQLRERFGWYTVVDLTQTILRCTLIAVVLTSGYTTAVAAVAAYSAAPWLIACAALLIGVGIRAGVRARRADFSDVVRSAGLSLATTSVGAVVSRLDLFLMSIAGTAAETGVFAAASTLALVPTWLGAYLAPTLSGRILPYCRARRMKQFFAEVQGVLLIAGVVGMVVGVTLGPALILRFLPPGYAGAARVVPVLLGAGVAGFVTFPLILHTLLFLSPRTYLVMDLISIVFVVPAYIVAARRFGALGVAWVTSVSAVVKALIAQTAAATAVRRAEAESAYGVAV